MDFSSLRRKNKKKKIELELIKFYRNKERNRG